MYRTANKSCSHLQCKHSKLEGWFSQLFSRNKISMSKVLFHETLTTNVWKQVRTVPRNK